MDLNFALAMDDQTAQKVLGGNSMSTTRNQTFIGEGYGRSHDNCRCGVYQGPRAPCKKMKATDLRYTTEEQIEKWSYQLTDAEDKLQKILQIEHNTIDIINENLKLKESLRFVKSSYASDMNQSKAKQQELEHQMDELKEKLKAANKDADVRVASSNDLQAALDKRKKEFEEMARLLGQKEKEIDTVNKLAEQLLSEKKRLLGMLEQKDRNAEDLNKNLFAKEQKLQNTLEDSNRVIKDLQAEKAQLLDTINGQNDRINDLTKYNTELAADLKRAQRDLKEALNRPVEDESAKQAIQLKLRELEALKAEMANLKNQSVKDKDSMSNLKSQLENEQKKNNILKKELDNLNSKLKENEAALDEERRDCDELADKLDDYMKQKKEVDDQLEELKKKHQKLLGDFEDAQGAKQEYEKKNAAMKDELDKTKEQLDNKVNDFNNLKKELDKLKADRDKQNARIRELENELANKKAAVDKLTNDKDAIVNEMKDLQKKFQDSDSNKKNQANELEKQNNANKNKIKELQDELDEKDRKVRNLMDQIKSLNDKANDLDDEVNRLRDDNDALVQKLSDLAKDKRNSDDEKNKFKGDLDRANKKAEQLENDLKDKEKALADLAKEKEALKEAANSKKELDDLKKNFFEKFKEILKKIAMIKEGTCDILDILVESETSTFSADEAKINKLTTEQYFSFGLQLLNEIDSYNMETREEVMSLKETVLNLQREKQILLDKHHELEEKLADLRTRHDIKTDMVGKLTVKTFILMTEIQRLSSS